MHRTGPVRANAPVPLFPADRIDVAIARRRQRIAALEQHFADACEAAALRGIPPTACLPREAWELDTWRRYLTAAARLAPLHTPPIQQLYREIEQLGRVATLPRRAGAAA